MHTVRLMLFYNAGKIAECAGEFLSHNYTQELNARQFPIAEKIERIAILFNVCLNLVIENFENFTHGDSLGAVWRSTSSPSKYPPKHHAPCVLCILALVWCSP